MAQIAKVVCQFEARQLAPTLYTEADSPLLDLENCKSLRARKSGKAPVRGAR